MSHAEPSFNLIDEGWILALDHGGQLRQVSLAEAFEQSTDISQLVGELPTQTFAIQRLLLAILHRALGGPQDLATWRRARDDWGSAVRAVRGYLETFRDRFCLVHPTTPFFQVATLHTAKDEISGLEKLIADVPNGEPYLTMRLGRGLGRITWAEAARWLVHVQAFDPSGIRSGVVGDPRVKAGKGYPIGTGWAGRIGGVSLAGDTLCDTLLLNLVVPGEASRIDSPDDDAPPWERPQVQAGEEVPGGREPRGPVDLYTWQSRRVRLVGDADGVVGLVLAQGDRVREQNRQRVEPMTAWRYSKPQSAKFGRVTYMPRRHDPERAFWRGLVALLPEASPAAAGGEPAAFQQPALLRWAGELRARGLIPDRLVRVHAVGAVYGANEATIDEIVDDELSLPVVLLTEGEGELRRIALDAVTEAEAAVRALTALARNIALAAGAGPDDAGPARTAQEIAYAALDGPFRRWLASLHTHEDPVDARTRWQQEVRRIIYGISRDLVRDAGPQAFVGRQVGPAGQARHVDLGRADVWFHRGLAAALPRAVAAEEQQHEEVAL